MNNSSHTNVCLLPLKSNFPKNIIVIHFPQIKNQVQKRPNDTTKSSKTWDIPLTSKRERSTLYNGCQAIVKSKTNRSILCKQKTIVYKGQWKMKINIIGLYVWFYTKSYVYSIHIINQLQHTSV